MAETDAPPVVDWDAALAHCLGREALLREIVGMFRVEKARRMADLDEALTACDRAGVRHAAHEMKGMARVMAAGPLLEAAQALERAAVEGDGDLHSLRDALAREVARLDHEIARRFGP